MYAKKGLQGPWKLICLSIVLLLAGCKKCKHPQSQPHPAMTSLELAIASPTISAHEQVPIHIKHTGKTGSSAIDLASYQLGVAVVEQIDPERKQQTDTQLFYQDSQQKSVNAGPQFKTCLTQLADPSEKLEAGQTKTVYIGIQPGKAVTAVKCAVQLLQADGDQEKVCCQQELRWTAPAAGTQSSSPLQLIGLSDFTSNRTQFHLQASSQVLLGLAGLQIQVIPAGFGFVQSDGSTTQQAKLTDLLGTSLLLPGQPSASITLQAESTQLKNASEPVIISIVNQGQTLATQTVTWKNPTVIIHWEEEKHPFVGNTPTTCSIMPTGSASIHTQAITVHLSDDQKFTLLGADGTIQTSGMTLNKLWNNSGLPLEPNKKSQPICI